MNTVYLRSEAAPTRYNHACEVRLLHIWGIFTPMRWSTLHLWSEVYTRLFFFVCPQPQLCILMKPLPQLHIHNFLMKLSVYLQSQFFQQSTISSPQPCKEIVALKHIHIRISACLQRFKGNLLKTAYPQFCIIFFFRSLQLEIDSYFCNFFKYDNPQFHKKILFTAAQRTCTSTSENKLRRCESLILKVFNYISTPSFGLDFGNKLPGCKIVEVRTTTVFAHIYIIRYSYIYEVQLLPRGNYTCTPTR